MYSKKTPEFRKKRDVTPLEGISGILDTYIKNSEMGHKLRRFSLFNHWPEIVGKEISDKTKPEKIFKGILYISVENPTWASELTMMSGTLIAKINTYIGEEIINQLRFKIER